MSAIIEVSFGELIDKITILEIKAVRIAEPVKNVSIRKELQALDFAWGKIPDPLRCSSEVLRARADLKRVNEQLWDIEDAIRELERAKCFDANFIELARRVYLMNDERARLKKILDGLMGSRFSEEKSYQPY
jgi:Family of unknown function (DUF6165)